MRINTSGIPAKQRRKQWPQIRQPLAARAQNDYGEGQFVDRLLKCKIAIDCDESVKLTGSLGKQGAIVNTGPAGVGHRLNFVSV
jgi:hypothetical protein